MAKSTRDTLLTRLPKFLKKEQPAKARRKGERLIGPKPAPSLHEQVRRYLKECQTLGKTPEMWRSGITRQDMDFFYLRNTDLSSIHFPPETNFNGMNLCGTKLRMPTEAQINHTTFGRVGKNGRKTTLVAGSSMPRHSHVFHNDNFNSSYMDGLEAIEGLDADPRYRQRLQVPKAEPVAAKAETLPETKVTKVVRYKKLPKPLEKKLTPLEQQAHNAVKVESESPGVTQRMIRRNKYFRALGLDHSQESIELVTRLRGDDLDRLRGKLQANTVWLFSEPLFNLDHAKQTAYEQLKARFAHHVETSAGQSQTETIQAAQNALEELTKRRDNRYTRFNYYRASWLKAHEPEIVKKPAVEEVAANSTPAKRTHTRENSPKNPDFVSPLAAMKGRVPAHRRQSGSDDPRRTLDALLAEDDIAPSRAASAAALRDQILDGMAEGQTASSARAGQGRHIGRTCSACRHQACHYP